MAILTNVQLAVLRRNAVSDGIAETFTKPQANAALQAIEDWWVANQAALSSAIDVAVAPFAFTNLQKRTLAKMWLRGRFERGN